MAKHGKPRGHQVRVSASQQWRGQFTNTMQSGCLSRFSEDSFQHCPKTQASALKVESFSLNTWFYYMLPLQDLVGPETKSASYSDKRSNPYSVRPCL